MANSLNLKSMISAHRLHSLYSGEASALQTTFIISTYLESSNTLIALSHRKYICKKLICNSLKIPLQNCNYNLCNFRYSYFAPTIHKNTLLTSQNLSKAGISHPTNEANDFARQNIQTNSQFAPVNLKTKIISVLFCNR